MSSILDALKKAEQESAMDSGAGTPWSAPLPVQSPYRKRTRRWWVPLGIVVGLCVLGVVFWQVDTQQQTRPAKTMIDASPRQATEKSPASTVQEHNTMAAVPPVQPEKKPLHTATPKTAPRVQPSPLPLEKTQRQATAPTSEPLLAPAADPNRRPTDSAKAAGQFIAEPRNTVNSFRSDPRIDLQALVWAPESAARFVVINNRLLKEGGSLDNIVVVRINPDDVLLAEGSDRWHEAFKIR